MVGVWIFSGTTHCENSILQYVTLAHCEVRRILWNLKSLKWHIFSLEILQNATLVGSLLVNIYRQVLKMQRGLFQWTSIAIEEKIMFVVTLFFEAQRPTLSRPYNFL